MTDQRGRFVTPMRVVLLAAILGAALVVSGVALAVGTAYALITAGALVLAGVVVSLHDFGDIP